MERLQLRRGCGVLSLICSIFLLVYELTHQTPQWTPMTMVILSIWGMTSGMMIYAMTPSKFVFGANAMSIIVFFVTASAFSNSTYVPMTLSTLEQTQLLIVTGIMLLALLLQFVGIMLEAMMLNTPKAK